MLDPDMMDTYRGLSSPQDPHFFKNFMTAYLDGIPVHITNMRASLTEKDPKKLAHAAHAVKSSSLNLGIQAVVEVCAKLQKLGEQADLTAAAPLVPQLETLIAQAIAEIRALPEFKS